MSKPYTIRLFVPDGDPNTFKIIDKMNWTGIGLEISRDTWINIKIERNLIKQAYTFYLATRGNPNIRAMSRKLAADKNDQYQFLKQTS